MAVRSSNVMPNSGTVGRKRATLRTVKPERLKQITATASVSVAVRDAAYLRVTDALTMAASEFDRLRIAWMCSDQLS